MNVSTVDITIKIILYFVFSLLRWYAQTGAEPMLVLSGPRTRLLGSMLAIEAVTLEDSGIYRCSASNTGGEASAEIR